MRHSSATTSSKLWSQWLLVWLGIIVAVLTLIILYPQVLVHQNEEFNDVYEQIQAVQAISDHGPWNLYSIFYLLVYTLSFGSRNIYILIYVTIGLLMASVTAKWLLSYYVLEKTSHSRLLAMFISLGLVLVMPLPNWWKPDQIYIDKIAPNIWFDATTILTTPFAILLFFSALRWLEALTLRTFIWVAVSTLLSVLTKPNYVLAFYPILGLVVLIRAASKGRHDTRRALLLYTGLGLVLCGILYFQYLDTIAKGGVWADPSVSKGSAHVVFAPLAVWSLYSPNIPASLLLSLVFPLSVVALYFKEVKTNAGIGLAWSVLAIAILQYALLAETGTNFGAANWSWGSNIAMYLLFLVSASVVVSQQRSPRFYFVMTFFCLHLVSGIYHYVKLTLGGGYF
jgi:hypothetical protein